MTISTLTSKGQATIPKEIRDHLGVKPRERIVFSIEGERVVIKRASYTTQEAAGSLKQANPKPLPSKSQLKQATAKSVLERDLRTKL